MVDKILIVEDKDKNLADVNRMRDNGLEVDVAKSFSEASQLLGYVDSSTDNPSNYDVVISDLMFPFGEGGSGLAGFTSEGERLRYTEQPLGYAVALFAAKQKIPLIGILTDLDHHSGPVAGTFDLLYGKEEDTEKIILGYRSRHVFRLNDSKFVMFDNRDLKPLYLKSDGKLLDEYESGESMEPVKNWQEALIALRSIA